MNVSVKCRDAGEGSLSYFLVVLLIAACTGAIALSGLGTRISDWIGYAVCVAAGGGDESKCHSPADLVMQPTCTVELAVDGYTGTVEALIFSVGRDWAFMRTTSIDPRTGERVVRITGIRGSSIGVGTGLGIGLNGGNLVNIGADASVGANLRLGNGDAWEFTGPDADEQADALRRDLVEQYTIDEVKNNGGLLGYIGGNIYDAFAGPDIPEANIRRHETEIDAFASLDAGLSIGWPAPSGRHRKPDRSTEPEGRHRKPTLQDRLPDSRGTDSVSPNLRAWVAVDGNEKLVVEENERTGETTTTMMLRGETNYGEQHVVGGNQGQVTSMGAMSLTTDRDGRLTKVTLAQTHVVNGRATVTTTTVPITTEQQRRDAADYLSGAVPIAGTAARNLSLTWDDMAPTQDPGPDAHPFLRNIFQNGMTSRVDYAHRRNDASYGASIKLGLQLGANLAISTTDRSAQNAQYLGAPTSDGRRLYKDLKACR
ncbi:hypothetical protein ABZ801_28040 [Actinomadura sp. NPDC047616]|uniref:hypothetical protein n=1 Tax=Actinomadura sp. NPDC047616 TaxID=3155914 RepID=UPI0033EFC181